MSDPVLESALTCPACGHVEVATMQTDGRQFFYECPNCHAMLRPKPGDCCVFCSYGSVVCPPQQTGGADPVARTLARCIGDTYFHGCAHHAFGESI